MGACVGALIAGIGVAQFDHGASAGLGSAVSYQFKPIPQGPRFVKVPGGSKPVVLPAAPGK